MIGVLSAVSTSVDYSCGNIGVSFPGTLPYVISMIILLIKIVVPILLILFGMIDLGKAVMAQKEDEIKKGQQTFIKRLVAAAIVFFVITIVTILIKFLSNKDSKITSCFNCFITGEVAENSCVADLGGQAGL